MKSEPLADHQSLGNKRFFLTGGTGLFGKWLLDFFLPLEAEVVVLSRDPDCFLAAYPGFGSHTRFSFVQGDVRDFEFPDGRFDYVIHAATPVTSDALNADSPEMYSIIVDGTKRVIEFAGQADVKRLLYVSSGAVYGTQPPELSHIPETFPCNPVTAYGKGKWASESICFDSGIPCIAARCFAFVGPYMPLDAHFAIGNFIGNCLRNEPIEIEGDGTPLRSYMYSSDLVSWLLKILICGKSGAAYNVGSKEAISIVDLARRVRNIAGTDNEIIIHKDPVPGILPPRYIPSVNKAVSELKLSSNIDLKAAIFRTLEWIRENRPKSSEKE